MKRNYRRRLLGYEQLESKAAPSSILMVALDDGIAAAPFALTTNSVATESSLASECRDKTEQILRFIAENTTGSERAHRPAVLPTAEQCEVADEMIGLGPAHWNSFIVLGYYDNGIEL